MYKDIKRHAELLAATSGTVSLAERADLYRFHVDRLRDFQHERLIHLLVTLFFGGLVIVSVTVLAVMSVARVEGLVIWLMSFMSVLLTALEVCYIWYYYLLENGVQRLYRFSNQLAPMLSDKTD